MDCGENQDSKNSHKQELAQHDERQLELPLLWAGKDDEEYQVNYLNNETPAINGDHQEAVGVYNGESVQYPQTTVDECCQVRDRRVLLH